MVAKKRKKPASRPRARSAGKVFMTPFIKDCVDFILEDPAIKFMGREPRKVTVKNFGTIAATLLGASEVGVDPGAPPPADPVAAALTAFLLARPWPPAGRNVGPAGFTSLPSNTVRRVEVAEILEKLIERVNHGSGGGGGGSDWPPHVRT